MGREGERTGEMLPMSAGCQRLISRRLVTVEAAAQLGVEDAVLDLLVLPGCCLPHHLQLHLYVPKDKEGSPISQVQASIYNVQ